MSKIFKPGDKVKFKGLKAGSITLEPREGILRIADSNTTVKGVVTIIGDKQQLLFVPTGAMYCHEHHGILLESILSNESDELQKKLGNLK